ncbi:hypothetical protein TrLO_g13745 [Triparma laevis f. longispina]|uniref:Uncharacterized protein n=1 Tax=Triparma laevis f. longispina TaxID=1714387 RepID=A0A9W7FQ29_9STRA|nr:hypothetical protein TrLO_g13745 [Triparma laevis f. longispina]
MKLRNNKIVEVKAKTSPVSASKTSAKSKGKSNRGAKSAKAKPAKAVKEKKHKKCERRPRGGVMCASCMIAGHTPTSWREYHEEQNRKRAAGKRVGPMPSNTLAVRKSAPLKSRW